jgi:hypothetical protein
LARTVRLDVAFAKSHDDLNPAAIGGHKCSRQSALALTTLLTGIGGVSVTG